jgi:hypothetical protein
MLQSMSTHGVSVQHIYAQYEWTIAHDEVWLCVVESGDAGTGGNLLLRADKQASKSGPTRPSGLVVKNKKEVYRDRIVYICSISKEKYSRLYKSEIIVMTRMKTTLLICRHSSLSLATP